MGINFLVISFLQRYQTLHFWVVVRAEPNVKGSVVVVAVAIAVGQWLVSGLHWSSSARQSLAARQKELSK